MKMSNGFARIVQRFSISSKLVMIAMISTTVGLLVAGIALSVYNRQRMKDDLVQGLMVSAQLIAERSNAALLFSDVGLARENLASLRVAEEVTHACIYTENGSVFASYPVPQVQDSDFPVPLRERRFRFDSKKLEVFEPIIFEGRWIGAVYVQARLTKLERAWKNHLLATLLIILLAILTAFFLSFRLQRIVSEPIKQLALTAQIIAKQEDFSVRAASVAEDETGVLVNSFNLMLQTIETRNHDLVEINRTLEQRVNERTLELREAKERAESADLLKSAFLAAMSHELRTPLNSIIGFTGIMLQGLPGPLNAEQTKQLGMVQGSARHLLDLINDILDLSKIEAGQLNIENKPFAVADAIVKTQRLVAPLAEKKGLELTLHLDSRIGELTGDRRRFEQILINLLNNAVKFSDRGGIDIDAFVENGGLTVRVCDTGIGIKAEDMDKLFNTFQQIDSGLTRNHEGSGLGLSICKKLVEMMGQITVSSQWGQGSTFSFWLPLNRQQEM